MRRPWWAWLPLLTLADCRCHRKVADLPNAGPPDIVAAPDVALARAWTSPRGVVDPGEGWVRVPFDGGAAWEAQGRHGVVTLVALTDGGSWEALERVGGCKIAFAGRAWLEEDPVDVATCMPSPPDRVWLGWARGGPLAAVAVPEGERIADTPWLEDVVARVWRQVRVASARQ